MPDDEIKAALVRLEGKVDKLLAGDGTSANPGYAGELALLKARLTAVEGHWAKVWAILTIPIGALVIMAVNSIYGHK